MRIGVFGLGLIGKAFIDHGRRQGLEVRGFSRSARSGDTDAFDASRGGECAALARSGIRLDAVIVTFPPRQAAPLFWDVLAELAETRILLGTTSIYRRIGTKPRIDEETPLRRTHPRRSLEDGFRTRGGILIRLSGIYGGPRNPLRWIEAGRVGYEDRQVNLVHCDDIARALIRICAEGARHPVYNLSDGRRHTWRQIIDFLVSRQLITHQRVPEPARRHDAFVTNQRFLDHYPGFRFRDLFHELTRMAAGA